jgi:hypothetical protein
VQLDIPLAGWVLSVLTFAAGTIVPVIFRRLSYEGLSVKQPLDVRAVFQDDDSQRRSELVFGTLVKIANAGKDALIIDDIQTGSLEGFGGRFTPIGVDVKAYDPHQTIRVPPSPASPEEDPDYMPLLIKDETERLLSLGLWFRYSQSMSEVVDQFGQLAADPGIKVHFRINGKYRPYVLHAKPSDRWHLPAAPLTGDSAV